MMHRLLLALFIPSVCLADPRLTQAPIVGRAGPQTMAVWARTDQPAAFRVVYGLTPEKLDLISAVVRTDPEHDLTAWVKLVGLRPDTRYYYRVTLEGGEWASGEDDPAWFHTWPDEAELRRPNTNPRGLFNFSFIASTCADQGVRSPGPQVVAMKTAWRLFGESTLFSIQHGDFIYEDGRDYTAEQWRRDHPEAGAPRILDLAPAVAGVWNNYRLYFRRSPALSRWHAHIPNFAMYDDHEILNDIDGAGVPGYRSRQVVFRDVALRAWHDYLGWANPVSWPEKLRFGKTTVRAGDPVLTDPAADFSGLDPAASTLLVQWGLPTDGLFDPALDQADGGGPNARVYGITQVADTHTLRLTPAPKADGKVAYTVGARHYYSFRIANCEIFVTDTRGMRGVADVARPDDPAVSMLGAAQLAWLKQAMAASDADFLFVVSGVPLTIPHTGKGGFVVASKPTDEAWTGFLHEREGLINFWDGLGRPVLVLTGDVHNSCSVRVTDRVWEFGCSPLNSGNHDLPSESNRPTSGPFVSGGRQVDIRWSSFFRGDMPRELRQRPMFTRVQVNNVFDNPLRAGESRPVAYDRPQVVVQFYDGRTGDLLYAEAVTAAARR